MPHLQCTGSSDPAEAGQKLPYRDRYRANLEMEFG
jgi:hypothetical protein